MDHIFYSFVVRVSSAAAFILKAVSYFETPHRMSPCCLPPPRFSAPTLLPTPTPTMSASPRALCSLLLGLLLVPLCSPSRFRIPPHDQVARVARFVVHQCDWASLATISTHKPVVGRPFSNTFSVSDGPAGSGSGVPYLYLTRMEVSVQDLQVGRPVSGGLGP